MSNYRRLYREGGIYFFTVVTYKRRRILIEEDNINLLRCAFKEAIKQHPFEIKAIVVLPDHLHCVWTLPLNDLDFSVRWKKVKTIFSRDYKGSLPEKSESMLDKQEKGVWQRRFWEHCIRDQDDYKRHLDYIHYNPVKHGLVSKAIDWPYGSFKQYVAQGIYSADWGSIPK
ncbi:MAG: transposase [Candidatus Desantisbacteria bacterium]